MAEVQDHRRSVSQDGESQRHAKLSGTLPWATELAHEAAVRIDDHDARGLAIEDVQVPVRVEAGSGNVTERLPNLTVERADPVDPLVVGAQRAVRARQLDDLLRPHGVHRDDESGNAPAHPRSYHNVPHSLSLPSWSILHLRQM